MILNARNRKPKISFGLGVLQKSLQPGDDVTIWLENVYNELMFDFTVMGVPVRKISSFEWKVEELASGNYEINLLVHDKNKKGAKELKSNTLTLTVE